MTHKQRQNLLQFLGYDPGTPDNIWGNQSQRAMGLFQYDFGLPVTGTGDPITDEALLDAVAHWEPERAGETTGDDWWDEIEYFDRSEFKCTCGGRGCNGFPAEPRERLIRNADAARKHFGRPAIVSSGVRCQLRNSELPGSAANSLHLSGRAMDFGIPGVRSYELMQYLWTLPDVHECYQIDETYVHMGVEKY